jgi:hypothetical protein
MPKIILKTKPNCKFCLGTGISISLFAGIETTCRCITEQIVVLTVPADYSIMDRYEPGKPEYIEEVK